MDLLVIVTCGALAVTLIAFVMAPFVGSSGGRDLFTNTQQSGKRMMALQERKEQLYASIKELEFDHSVGKLATEEYKAHRRNLEEEAIGVLRLLDTNNSPRQPQDSLLARIEQDVEEVRSRIDVPAAATTGFCSHCGAEREREHRFCAQCGTQL